MGEEVTRGGWDRTYSTQIVGLIDVYCVIEDPGNHGEGGLGHTERDSARAARLVLATIAGAWEASRVYNSINDAWAVRTITGEPT